MNETVKQSFVTSISTVINGLLGIAFYVLLGRFLGPEKFGIVSVVLVTLTLIADIANVGTDTGIVRFVGKYRHKDLQKTQQFLKLALKVKVIAGISVFAIGWFLLPFIATSVLNKPELTQYLKYSLLGAFGILLFSLTTSAIQAFEKFKTWGILNIALNLLRLVGIIVIFRFGFLTVGNTLQTYIIFPFIGFVVGSLFLPNYLTVKISNDVHREFFHYNKWVALFILIAAISARLDTYLSTRLLTLTQVGIYSAAVTVAGIGSQIVAGIATVVAPKLASFDSNKKVIDYLKNLQIFVFGLGVTAIVVGIPLAYVAIPTLFGSDYSGAVAPFIVLLISQVIFLISIPVHTAVFYYFSKPSLFVFISCVHVVIIGGLGWILISNFGYMGAAYTVLVGNLSNFLIPGIWVVNKFRSEAK